MNPTERKSLDWTKYILALFITVAMFATAYYLSSRFNNARIADIRGAEDQLSMDLLSNETQYELLGEQGCEDITKNPGLSDVLNSLASRLSYAEDHLGATDSEVMALKKQYSLLEIKDYLLMQKIAAKCGSKTRPGFILYFYSNVGNCTDCAREGEVLTYLRQTYPLLRVYSFDYGLDLSAAKTLISVRNIGPQMPALVINNRPPVYGFQSVDSIIKFAPEIGKMSTTTATTTGQD